MEKIISGKKNTLKILLSSTILSISLGGLSFAEDLATPVDQAAPIAVQQDQNITKRLAREKQELEQRYSKQMHQRENYQQSPERAMGDNAGDGPRGVAGNINDNQNEDNGLPPGSPQYGDRMDMRDHGGDQQMGQGNVPQGAPGMMGQGNGPQGAPGMMGQGNGPQGAPGMMGQGNGPQGAPGMMKQGSGSQNAPQMGMQGGHGGQNAPQIGNGGMMVGHHGGGMRPR